MAHMGSTAYGAATVEVHDSKAYGKAVRVYVERASFGMMVEEAEQLIKDLTAAVAQAKAEAAKVAA